MAGLSINPAGADWPASSRPCRFCSIAELAEASRATRSTGCDGGKLGDGRMPGLATLRLRPALRIYRPLSPSDSISLQ